MNLKVKQKIINGKKIMGIINENLKEVAPFEFKSIVKVSKYGYEYYVCEMEDGSCSLYNADGLCLLDYTSGYKDVKPLKYSLNNNNSICVSAKKDEKVGILRIGLVFNDGYVKPSGQSTEVLYEFGLCDEIREFKDETVQLVKHTKDNDFIGYWYHKNIKELVTPNYLSYDYYRFRSNNGVGLFKMKNENGDSEPCSHSLSDFLEYNKLTPNVEMIKYSKLENESRVIGLKQKVYGSNLKFEDFLPAVYSDIKYDKDAQMFFLEQIVDNQVKKGFMGVTFDWHFRSQGWWIWGYPNLKTVVNVPCEYDDIEIIDSNYALLKKNNKYGLIKFSFGKTNGDWDSFNRVNYANGRCREIVPCVYEIIDKVNDNFIGKINNEERIITDAVDKKTKKPIVVGNNYKKVKQISDKIFLCDLEEGKKEVVVIDKYYEGYYQWQDRLSNVSKITPCDDATLIGNDGYGYLLKVINDNNTNVYLENKDKNIEKIEGDIANVKYDEDNNFFVVTMRDGNVKYMRGNGEVIFTTDTLGIDTNNMSISYLKEIDKFKVINSGLTRVYSSLDKRKYSEVFENRLFSSFNVLHAGFYTFTRYTEVLESGLATKLSHVDINNRLEETEILEGDFQVEDIVSNGCRIIFSKVNSETGQKKYGVIESQEGNICIDPVYDDIQYSSYNSVFVCRMGDEKIVLDIDGFVNEGQKVSINKNSLKLTL